MKPGTCASLLCCLALILAACGGGGGGGAATPVAPPGGSLDTSFDTDGKVISDFIGSFDRAAALAIQSDGKIVVAGSVQNGTHYDFVVARYLPDGQPDLGFDTDGRFEIDLSSGRDDFAHALAIQPDGKIVVAGSSFNAAGDTVFAVVRLLENGQLDSGFGAGGGIAGAIKTNFGGAYSAAAAIAIQTDGKIVVAGSADGSSGTIDFALARYSGIDGSLDTSFGADGKVTTDLVGDYDAAYAVAIQSDGKIVVAGNTFGSGGTLGDVDAAMVRYNSDGSRDEVGAGAFGVGGKVTISLSPVDVNDILYALAIQPDGKIVAAGYAWNGIDNDFVVIRCNANGSLDTSFGTGGMVLADIGASGGFDQAAAVVLQADGRVVVAGTHNSGGGSIGDDFALLRLNANGSLDSSFDTDGRMTFDFAGNGDRASAVAIQADGKIVVAGQTFNGTDDDFALVRINP
jgi:uncharacterized delta-60 repeat protein